MDFKPKSNFNKPPKNLPKQDNMPSRPNKNDIEHENTAHNPSRKDPSNSVRNTNNKPKKKK